MTADLLQGKLVRLEAFDDKEMAEAISRWSRDSEYLRKLDTGPALTFSVKFRKEWLEKESENDSPKSFMFAIRSIEDARLIGEISLDGVQWHHGDTFIAIGIGERDYWNRGYGTDAMRVMLRYAFCELNLHRISLNVFGYNYRALSMYEKIGFQHEGRQREYLYRDGRRWDLIYMGILNSEWKEQISECGL